MPPEKPLESPFSTRSCSACGAALPPGQERCVYCGTLQAEPKAAPIAGLPIVPNHPIHIPPGPRLVEYLKRGSGCLGLPFGLGFLVFAGIFTCLALGSYFTQKARYDRLSREGQPIQAQVTAKDMDEDSEGDTYYITYRYTAPLQGQPQKFTQRQSVSRETYEQTPDKGSLRVIYARSDPDVAVIASELAPPSRVFVFLFSLMPLVFGGVGAYAIWRSLADERNRRRLGRDGQVGVATLTRRFVGQDSDGDDVRQVAFTYTVPDRNGQANAIRQECTHDWMYANLRLGMTFYLRYLPDKPKVYSLDTQDALLRR